MKNNGLEEIRKKIDWPLLRTRVPKEICSKAESLVSYCQNLSDPILAFSGGVDSAVVAAFLFHFSSGSPKAVTAVSPSLSARQKENAALTAEEIGIPHLWINTFEFQDPGYQANQSNRCFFCKSHLYQDLQAISEQFPDSQIVSGTNFDDLSDHRPGLVAAKDFEVLQPLASCKVTKKEVRQLAAAFGLSCKNLPASPCLASRIAYGVRVTPERLSIIEKAEEILWKEPFSDLRVRLMPDLSASIEVPQSELSILENHPTRTRILTEIQRLGFPSVSIDPDGLRSGKMNQLLKLEKK